LAAAPVKVAGLLVEVLLLDIVVYVKAEVVELATTRELGIEDVTNEVVDGKVVDDLVVDVVADVG
jgi:hypothetical protein